MTQADSRRTSRKWLEYRAARDWFARQFKSHTRILANEADSVGECPLAKVVRHTIVGHARVGHARDPRRPLPNRGRPVAGLLSVSI